MVNMIKDLKKVVTEMIRNEINDLKGVDLYVVTGMGDVSLTVNIKRITQNESYDNVEMLGLGLGNGKGQIKMPNINDVVLVTFLPNSETPIILGTLFDTYSSFKDAKIDVLRNEYFVNNRTNGAYIHINEDNNITTFNKHESVTSVIYDLVRMTVKQWIVIHIICINVRRRVHQIFIRHYRHAFNFHEVGGIVLYI